MKFLYIILCFFDLIYIFISFPYSKYSLIFPFETIPINELENISIYNESYTNNILRDLYESNIFIDIKLGSPIQKIKLKININSDDFFIVKPDADFDRNYPKRNGSFYFNQSLSTTFDYQINKEDETYFSHPHLSNYVQDNFYFISSYKKESELNIKNFQFLLAYKVRESEHGVIGLKGFCNIMKRIDFFTSLKNYNLTNNYIWYLKYEENKKGNLVIGNYPHDDEYYKQNCNNCIFQKKHFAKIYSNITKENWKNQWGLNFKNIYIHNKNEYENILIDCERCKLAEFNPNLGIIKGPKKYEEIIKESLFNKYINLKLCFTELFIFNKDYQENYYYYYYCNISLYNNLKNDFNSIIFEHKLFNTNFSLDFDDLFIIENEFIFFKIIFDDYSNWIFGSPFLSKYFFVFNSDTKEIGYYSKNIVNIIKNTTKNKSYDIFILIKIIGIIILGSILIGIGIFIGKKLYGAKRKMRINELEENFEI